MRTLVNPPLERFEHHSWCGKWGFVRLRPELRNGAEGELVGAHSFGGPTVAMTAVPITFPASADAFGRTNFAIVAFERLQQQGRPISSR
jgi:hypothetical protein